MVRDGEDAAPHHDDFSAVELLTNRNCGELQPVTAPSNARARPPCLIEGTESPGVEIVAALISQLRTGPSESPKPLWKLGYQLGPLGLGPSPRGAGAHISQRTERKREFCDVVAERCFGDDKNVMLAGG